jgi:hypothetical protein
VSASLSGMMAWLAGPSKGLLNIGREYGYLPPYFQQLNEQGIQTHILVAQGVTTTIIGLLYAFIPSVSSAYWIFSVMTTQIYLIMYVLMFVAAVRLRRDQPNHPRGYRAPALRTWCWIGGLASVLAILIGFVPPSQFGHTSPLAYGLFILLGIVLIGVAPPLLLYRLRKPSWKTAEATASPARPLPLRRPRPRLRRRRHPTAIPPTVPASRRPATACPGPSASRWSCWPQPGSSSSSRVATSALRATEPTSSSRCTARMTCPSR